MPGRVPPTPRTPRQGAVDRVPRSATDAARGIGRPSAGTRPRRSRWGQFVRTYGWRAYALPVLAIVTIGVAFGAMNSSGGSGATPPPQHTVANGPPTATGNISLKSDRATGSTQQQAIAAAALPTGPAYTTTGAGTFRTLPGSTAVVGKGPLYRYTIDVENGITGVDLNHFASVVTTTLADPRSWSGHGISLQRVSSGDADFHITLTSAMTVRQLCGYTVQIETSCFAEAGSTSAADADRVVLNDARWVRGSAAYIGDLAKYQVYMVNHETGHAVGHEHAHACLPGGLAPVMMQQTIGLVSYPTHQLCQANPWPYPPGVLGVPGAEAPDTAANSEVTLGHD